MVSVLRRYGLVGAVLMSLVIPPIASGQSILTAPLGAPEPYHLDSGHRDNLTDSLSLVFSKTVSVEGAAWLRLYFSGGDSHLAPGAVVVLTSDFDGASQHLDAQQLADWSHTSAYFNGDTVTLQLLAGPSTKGNRIVVDAIALGGAGGSTRGLCGICDGEDRALSERRWVGRMLPVGCTASMYTASGCFVSAGHCVAGFGAQIMQFNVPPSLPDGTPQHPAPQDQYPIDRSSIDFVNGGVGNDWGHFVCFPNPETGLLPIEAQGEYRPIAETFPDAFPVFIEIFGYGVSETGILNFSLKRSVGPLDGLGILFPGSATAWYFQADSTGGNSGSAILHEGEIIGIVTHCSVGCPNFGTPVFEPAFAAAREACRPFRRGDCDQDDDVDLDDLASLPDCLAGPGATMPGPECVCTDFNDDGVIDLRDVAILQHVFTGDLCVPAAVTQPPPDQIGCPGDQVVLFVEAGGTAPLAYQWLRDGVPIDGAAEPTYLIDDFEPKHVASYSVRVENRCGTDVSTPATLSPCTADLLSDNFESDQGWTVVSNSAMSRGQWLRAAPALAVTTYGEVTQPGHDNPYGEGTLCFATGPFGGAAKANDVDGGPTTLFSPLIDLNIGHQGLMLRYAYWFFRDNDDGDDAMVVSISNDGGQSWTPVTSHRTSVASWRLRVIDIDSLIVPTDEVQLRFSVEDTEGETILEALVDDVRILAAE